MAFYALQKLSSLIRSHLFIFAFISFALGDWSKKYCYYLAQRLFYLVIFYDFYGFHSYI